MNIEKPEELQLNELMRQYSITIFKLEEACQKLNTEIDKLTAARDNIKKPYVDILNDIETQIRLPMLDLKTSFVCAYGKINFKKGAVRRTWNIDALDQICDARKDIKNVIWAFREEKTGEPSITVKIADVGVN